MIQLTRSLRAISKGVRTGDKGIDATSGVAFGHASWNAVVQSKRIDYLEDAWFLDLVTAACDDDGEQKRMALVGVYLVFASLIIPALAIRKLPAKTALMTGWVIGAAGYGAGLASSAAWDLPSGPAIVWSLGLAALIGGMYLSHHRPA